MSAQSATLHGAISRHLEQAARAGHSDAGYASLLEISILMGGVLSELQSSLDDLAERVSALPTASDVREIVGNAAGGGGSRGGWIADIVRQVPSAWGRVAAVCLVTSGPVAVFCAAVLLALWGAGVLHFGLVSDAASALGGSAAL